MMKRLSAVAAAALLAGSSLPTTAGAEMTAEELTQQIIERCRASVGQYGANLVKVCVDQDLEAMRALGTYPESAREIIARCQASVGQYGWNLVKVCADQDIAAEEALSKY